ncbi:hypothetical protein AB0M35_17750 [Micromonospora sp. NPDC051196]|uniref:hypothetical protein n=1 Tax=Micromonospora sp. NPDC051196 TaxID=3155281 RepID=UPI00343B91DE
MDVDSGYRLRGALLAGVGVVALALGGGWWRAQAPVPSSGDRLGITSVDSLLAADWQEETVDRARYWQEPGTSSLIEIEPATGAVMVDPRTGRVVGYATESNPGRGAGRDGDRRVVLWTERASLSAGAALVREARLERGERNLLIFSCTGPGELLVTVIGAKAADPLTVGCDGTVITTEMTGTGANVTVSFSTAGAASLLLVARLIDSS